MPVFLNGLNAIYKASVAIEIIFERMTRKPYANNRAMVKKLNLSSPSLIKNTHDFRFLGFLHAIFGQISGGGRELTSSGGESPPPETCLE